MKKQVVVISLLVLSFVYLVNKTTYAVYASNVNRPMESNVAYWNILLNDTSLTDTRVNSISINNIDWNNTHVKDGKAAPGSTGVINLVVDPTSTEVAIKITIKVIDNTSDSDIVLTAGTITSSNITLTLDEDGNYTGIISLADINNGVKPVISIPVEWVNDDLAGNDVVSDNAKFLDLSLEATQYMG